MGVPAWPAYGLSLGRCRGCYAQRSFLTLAIRHHTICHAITFEASCAVVPSAWAGSGLSFHGLNAFGTEGLQA